MRGGPFFDVPIVELLLRCSLMAIQLLLVILLIKHGAYFFYQGF